jgi:hypothetical protein
MADQTIPNAVTVPIGNDGTLTLYSRSGGHLLFDATGYFVPVSMPVSGGRLITVMPTRVFDTRAASLVNDQALNPWPDQSPK